MNDESNDFFDSVEPKKVRKLKRAKHHRVPKEELETVIMDRPKRKLKRRTHQEDLPNKNGTEETDDEARNRRQQKQIADIQSRIERLKPSFHPWGVARWRAYYEANSATPFWILDKGTIAILLIARDYLQLFSDLKPPQTEADSVRIAREVTMKSWGGVGSVTGSVVIDSANGPLRVEYEGTMPDLVDKSPSHVPMDDDEDDGFGFVDSTVRPKEEVIQELKQADVMSVGGVIPTNEIIQGQVEDMQRIREAGLQLDPMKQKWAIAESLAKKPAAEILPAIGDDFELQAMVAYCRQWISSAGEVPVYPTNLIEIYHPKKALNMEPQVVKRREYIRAKVKDYLTKVRQQPSEGYNKDTSSYRKTLFKYKMEEAIEDYATAQPSEQGDATLYGRVGSFANEFFKAHFPLDLEGVKPGPIETLDPDYITYRGLIRKYNIKYGLLLHQVDL